MLGTKIHLYIKYKVSMIYVVVGRDINEKNMHTNIAAKFKNIVHSNINSWTYTWYLNISLFNLCCF